MSVLILFCFKALPEKKFDSEMSAFGRNLDADESDDDPGNEFNTDMSSSDSEQEQEE